jgi:hypothetical protein
MTGVFWIILVLFWLVCAGLSAYIAGEKGRDGGSWFVAGLFLGILAILALIAIPDEPEEEVAKQKQEKEAGSRKRNQGKGALLIDGKLFVPKDPEDDSSSDRS